MAVAKAYKKLFLAGLKWDAEDQAAPLYDVLKAAARARLTDTQGGKVLVSTASNGFSGTFSLPMNGQGITPQSAAELCQEMLEHYEAAKATVIAAGTPAPTDDQIYAEMILLINAASGKESYNNYAELRCG